MKRIAIRLTAVLSAVILFAGVFCGCTAKKEVSSEGLTITLPEDFVQASVPGQTVALMTDEVLFVALKETLSAFVSVGLSTEMSLVDYADTIIRAQNLSSTVQKNGDLVWFSYEKPVEGENWTYYAVVLRGSDAYWFLQFSCKTALYGSHYSDFVGWARSAEVS